VTLETECRGCVVDGPGDRGGRSVEGRNVGRCIRSRVGPLCDGDPPDPCLTRLKWNVELR